MCLLPLSLFFRQKEVLAHYLTAARMIPLRVDIWHNLERIFYAGIADAEGDEERSICLSTYP